MKILITLKDPDTLYDAVNEALETLTIDNVSDEELELIKEERAEKYRELASEWFEYGEYVNLELDTELKTMRVIPLKELNK